MIGVNSWPHKAGELKEVMTKEKINWRTFDDDGTINRQWNRPATPMFCILDHNGVIRRKWVGKVGEKTIDAALEKLIRETEKSTRRSQKKSYNEDKKVTARSEGCSSNGEPVGKDGDK